MDKGCGIKIGSVNGKDVMCGAIIFNKKRYCFFCGAIKKKALVLRDLDDEENNNSNKEAKKEVEEAKRDGLKAFREGHPDGYWRVFVERKESNDANSGGDDK